MRRFPLESTPGGVVRWSRPLRASPVLGPTGCPWVLGGEGSPEQSARETGPSCFLTASSLTAEEAFVKLPSKQFQVPGKDSSLLGMAFRASLKSRPRKSSSVHRLYMNLKLMCEITSGLGNVPQMVRRPCLRARRAVDRFISGNQTTERGADISRMKYLD